MKRILFVLFIVSHLNVFATEYYVSVQGNDKNDGLSEATAWRTITHAASKKSKLKFGDIVWIKAGNYGNENVLIEIKGLKGKPISFIGYKNKTGDINSMYYSYAKNKALDPLEMPMLDGRNRANGKKGISLHKSKYIVLKNIQITNYRWGIHGGNTSNSIIERILAISFGDVRTTAESGYGAQYGKGGNNVIKQCVFINATGANFRIEGDYNVINNVKSYGDDNSTGSISATDYYIHINGGNNNVIKNCYVERVGNLDHTGHGIGLKYNCQNNLIENCEIVNVKGAIEFRHSGVKNNTARNILIRGPLGYITFRDGASNNIVENSTVKNTNEGIRFYDQTEDGQGGLVASHNIVRNTIFSNIGTFIVATKSKKVSKTGYISSNQVINCTIDKANNIFEGDLPMDDTNEISNSIFVGVKKYQSKKTKYTVKWKNKNNNFFNNGFSSIKGNGNISENPKFEDASKGNYRLKSSSKLIDAGKNTDKVKTDFDGTSRPQGKSHDIGAFEFGDSSTGSLRANAGNDVSICNGDSVMLEASGEGSFKWNNGKTTKRITVNPSSTKKFTVTVTDKKGNKSSDSVVVNVIKVSADAGSDKNIEEGQNVKLTASGGDSYLWSNGKTTRSIVVSPSATKNYSVTVFRNGCESIDKVKVYVETKISNPPPAQAFAGDDLTICIGESVDLKASGGEFYTWSNGSNKTNIKVSPTRTTTYKLLATRGGVTNSDTIIVTVENCNLSGVDNRSDEGFTVYPNPTKGILNVNLDKSTKELNLVLTNLNGSIVYSDTMNSSQGSVHRQIDLSGFAKGVYYVRIFNSDQNMIKKILMI